MVSDKVEIVTKSYKKSKSIMWRSRGTKKFEILEASKKRNRNRYYNAYFKKFRRIFRKK
jgi:HSP90 family molecular chaperone